jgi:hypothetical protein
MEQTCRTCAYFDMRAFRQHYPDLSFDTGMGFCRRNPPMPDLARLVTTVSQLPRGQMPTFSVYPETCRDDWCGEWLPSAMRAAEAEVEAVPRHG